MHFRIMIWGLLCASRPMGVIADHRHVVPVDVPDSSDGTSNAIRVCGPNSLYLLLGLCNITVDRERMRAYLQSHPDGMSLLDLKRACAECGLSAEVRRCTNDDLRHMPFPVIAHVSYGHITELKHFIVITRRIGDDRIEIVDGTSGKHDYFQIDKMGNIWEGYLLVPVARSGIEQRIGWGLSCISLSFLGCLVLRGSRRRDFPARGDR